VRVDGEHLREAVRLLDQKEGMDRAGSHGSLNPEAIVTQIVTSILSES
jgi:hypothetical protein